jgi:hypothetical protein
VSSVTEFSVSVLPGADSVSDVEGSLVVGLGPLVTGSGTVPVEIGADVANPFSVVEGSGIVLMGEVTVSLGSGG